MRLIDADTLKAYIDAQKGRPWIGCTIGEALKIMTDEQPTIEPQRTGKWIDDEGNAATDKYCATCSACGEWSEYLTAYCPNCGAKME